MSSRLRRALPVESRWVDRAVRSAVRRVPVNVRPLLFVEQRRNYQGAALFAMANLTFHDLVSEISYADGGRPDGDEGPSDATDYRAEAADLVDWLVEHRCVGYSGFCGGHRHEVAGCRRNGRPTDLGAGEPYDVGTGEPNDPDVASTARAVAALLAAERLDDRYADIARTAAHFVVEDLAYRPVEGGATLDCRPASPRDRSASHGAEPPPAAGALGARLLVDLYDRFGDEALRERATALLDRLAERRTDGGGWTSQRSSGVPHLAVDHSGYVLESLLRYREAVDDRYEATLAAALEWYREAMFEDGGAPNFDATSAYPRDIHAATQGILVFTRAGDLGFADRIIDWTLENLHAGDGRFYRRKGRFYTRRTTLMRWCEARTAYALAEYLAAKHDRTGPHVPIR